MKLCVKIFISLFFILCAHAASRIDLFIFSKNRPLQLYALLESYEKYVTGTNQISVIYFADESYLSAYVRVQARFPKVRFVAQSTENPYNDFKPLLCSQVKSSRASHMLFAVDDIVVTDYVDLKQCAKLLKQEKAYGFYLRLGNDISECYTERISIQQPPLRRTKAGTYSWNFDDGAGDWNYPHTVDMTLFRKKDVWRAVKRLKYDSPNTFEQAWAAQSPQKKRGLCFSYSKIVNLPLNLVQEDFDNRHGSDYDIQFLLEKFEQGFRMDVLALHKFPHHAPHAEYQPTFIVREDRYQR